MFTGQDMPHYAAVLRLYASLSLGGAVAYKKHLYHFTILRYHQKYIRKVKKASEFMHFIFSVSN
jgi:hypothetical protein